MPHVKFKVRLSDMDLNQYKDDSKNIIKRYLDVKKCIDIQSIVSEIDELEKATSDKDFWNNSEKAKNILQSISVLKNKIDFLEKVLISLHLEM